MAKTANTAKNAWLKGDKGVTELKAYENVPATRGGSYSLTLLASANGRTYQMRLLLNDSTPLGFNTQRCVSVLADGWKNLADSKMLCTVGESISRFDSLPSIRAYAKTLFQIFEEYISYL